MDESGEVTELLGLWRAGDPAALERLIPIVYYELHRIADRYMRTEGVHTLQATALVNEAYLRLARESDRTWNDRTHFFAVAAQIMRNLLVDHARAAGTTKRGGKQKTIAIEAALEVPLPAPDELLVLDAALHNLEEADPRASRIVELRYFAGLGNSEIAVVLGVSEATVKRDWSAAKAWLRTQIRKSK